MGAVFFADLVKLGGVFISSIARLENVISCVIHQEPTTLYFYVEVIPIRTEDFVIWIRDGFPLRLSVVGADKKQRSKNECTKEVDFRCRQSLPGRTSAKASLADYSAWLSFPISSFSRGARYLFCSKSLDFTRDKTYCYF